MERLLSFDPLLLVILAVLFMLLILLFVMLFLTRSELNSFRTKYDSLIEYLGGGSSKDILQECVNIIHNLEFDNRIRAKEISELYDILSSCVQKVAILRYNAFSDVGSDLSFSIALLDNDDNGVVITNLYGRESSTTYAKPVDKGHSTYILTGEEEESIALARKKHIGKSYYGLRRQMEAGEDELPRK